MQVWYGSEQVPARLTDPRDAGTVVTVGIFDGVHRGHQAILARVVERARRMARPGGERPMAVAVTFDPHPVLVHRPEAHMPMVASLADRLEALAATGLDAVLVVHYTLDFADQGPEEFVRTWLEGLLAARAVVVGEDVRFGRGNSGDAALLERIGRADGLAVEIVDDVRSPSGRRWSSTWVRELLQAGDMQGAAEVLGHVHRLRGTVVHGRRRGRELGFPTANLDAASAGVVPPDGVYAGWLVRSPGAAALSGAAGRSPREERLPAAISIGTNPTSSSTCCGPCSPSTVFSRCWIRCVLTSLKPLASWGWGRPGRSDPRTSRPAEEGAPGGPRRARSHPSPGLTLPWSGRRRTPT